MCERYYLTKQYMSLITIFLLQNIIKKAWKLYFFFRKGILFRRHIFIFYSVLNVCSLAYQIRSVAQLCPILCNPMNCSTSVLPVHHQLPEFTHTHVHQVSDAIQPSHPLSSPSPLAPNPSQHQSLFQ